MQKNLNNISLQEIKDLYSANQFDLLLKIYDSLILQIENDLFTKSSSYYFLNDLFNLLSVDERPSETTKIK